MKIISDTFSMRAYCLLLPYLIYISGCGFQRANQVNISGVLYDSETESPIKNAKVKIKMTEPQDYFETSTSEKGEFEYSSDGELVIFSDAEDEENARINNRQLMVRFSHPDFVEDYYDDEVQTQPLTPYLADVGAFYLTPKDKEFLNE